MPLQLKKVKTMSNLTPYRQAEIVVSEEKAKPLFGLLIKPADHECPLPGWLKRFFKRVNGGSMFRCHCGRYYRLGYNNHYARYQWESQTLVEGVHYWKALGGEVE